MNSKKKKLETLQQEKKPLEIQEKKPEEHAEKKKYFYVENAFQFHELYDWISLLDIYSIFSVCWLFASYAKLMKCKMNAHTTDKEWLKWKRK